MSGTIIWEGYISDIKGYIHTLEWDLPRIENKAIKQEKSDELRRYKEQLQVLMPLIREAEA